MAAASAPFGKHDANAALKIAPNSHSTMRSFSRLSRRWPSNR
jgi:hypothetical protein